MLKASVLTLVSCVVAAMALVGIVRHELSPVDPAGDPRWFRVEAGQSLSAVSRELGNLGIIRESLAFSFLGRLRGQEGQVKPGRYRLSPSQSCEEILEQLVAGATHPIRIVFPEGIWLADIARVVADSLGLSADAVIEAASDREILGRNEVSAATAEGYLFPATYEFTGQESAKDVIDMLLSHGRIRWTESRAARAESLGWGRHETLTMASIIEAETAIADERPLVSAVYHRRLARGMLLQADPTVSYGLGLRGRGPTFSELKNASPYNTYVHAGLPPGPIGNPGEAAIDAALWPDPTCTALYFVASDDGTHRFTRTFADHLAARRLRGDP